MEMCLVLMQIIEIVCTELCLVSIINCFSYVKDGVGIVSTGGFGNTGVNCLSFGVCRASAAPDSALVGFNCYVTHRLTLFSLPVPDWPRETLYLHILSKWAD